jgi:hypothetical protein
LADFATEALIAELRLRGPNAFREAGYHVAIEALPTHLAVNAEGHTACGASFEPTTNPANIGDVTCPDCLASEAGKLIAWAMGGDA